MSQISTPVRPVGPAAAPVAAPTTVGGPVAVSPSPAPAVAQAGANGNAAADGSTGPVAGGTEGTPKKRGRKPRIDADEKRVPHPLLNANAEGATTTPLESVPSDYNEETHLPLRRKDFKSETIFLDWRADKLEAQAKQLRDESAKLKALGSAENQEDARKAIKLSKQLEELKKTLGGKLSPEQLKALGL